ncbi:hypothetical protein [Rosistilla oblonga]|uniref:hypothetical protein n=1 Tax=Rosistilla oblonga TaxID=2527990 RepID=UPI003A97BBFD
MFSTVRENSCIAADRSPATVMAVSLPVMGLVPSSRRRKRWSVNVAATPVLQRFLTVLRAATGWSFAIAHNEAAEVNFTDRESDNY